MSAFGVVIWIGEVRGGSPSRLLLGTSCAEPCGHCQRWGPALTWRYDPLGRPAEGWGGSPGGETSSSWVKHPECRASQSDWWKSPVEEKTVTGGKKARKVLFIVLHVINVIILLPSPSGRPALPGRGMCACRPPALWRERSSPPWWSLWKSSGHRQRQRSVVSCCVLVSPSIHSSIHFPAGAFPTVIGCWQGDTSNLQSSCYEMTKLTTAPPLAVLLLRW